MRNKDMSFCQNGPLTDRKAVKAARKEFGRGSLEVKAAKEDRKNEKKEKKETKKRNKRVKNYKATKEDVEYIKTKQKTARETPEFLEERAKHLAARKLELGIQ
tara:strand:- start:21 stop:329 length:309 start_codon:yes stop_codon:yes gene_type:complete